MLKNLLIAKGYFQKANREQIRSKEMKKQPQPCPKRKQLKMVLTQTMRQDNGL